MNQAPSQTARPRTYRLAELGLLILAIAVATSAYALVGLGVEDTIPANVYGYAAWLAALGVVLHIIVWIKAKYADPVLVPIAVLLNGLGLAMIYRVDLGRDEYLGSAMTQLVWMSLGVGLAIVVIFVVRDHRWLRRYTYVSGFGALVFLLLPLIPGIGKTINGARIWIGVGPLSFQPGEIAKILLAIFFAGYLVTYKDQLVAAGPKILGIRFPRLRDFGPIVVAWVASVGVLVFERDLGTSLLFFGLFVAMLYVATSKVSWIILGLGFFSAGAVAATFLFSHVGQRVSGWLNALTAEEYNKTPVVPTSSCRACSACPTADSSAPASVRGDRIWSPTPNPTSSTPASARRSAWPDSSSSCCATSSSSSAESAPLSSCATASALCWPRACRSRSPCRSSSSSAASRASSR